MTDEVNGARHLAHSPASGTVAVPVARTPSDTASNLTSRATSAPTGTPMSSRRKWSGAGIVRFSVRAMKAYLRDPEKNLADESNFERTEELRICRWCNFRGVCRPELPPFAESASSLSETTG